MEPHGQSPCLPQAGTLPNAHVGRHSGHTMAHSSTAKGRGLLVPEGMEFKDEKLAANSLSRDQIFPGFQGLAGVRRIWGFLRP